MKRAAALRRAGRHPILLGARVTLTRCPQITHTHSAFTALVPSKMHYFAPRTALQTFCALVGNIFERRSAERNQASTMVRCWILVN